MEGLDPPTVRTIARQFGEVLGLSHLQGEFALNGAGPALSALAGGQKNLYRNAPESLVGMVLSMACPREDASTVG